MEGFSDSGHLNQELNQELEQACKSLEKEINSAWIKVPQCSH